MIEVRSLRKSFGPVEALRDVSFSCGAGEVFGLLGPNGAGKTTCLRILATALRPDSGGATLAGYDLLTQAQSVRRAIGVLPAGAGLYGRLTARENLRYFGELYDLRGRRLEDRIGALLSRLGLENEMNRRAEGFSTGMVQKVALARAVLHDPPILFLDEPTEGLDVPTARVVYEMIEELAAAGKCIVFSTHRMEEAQRLCTRVGLIGRGEMRAAGTVEDLKRQTGAADLEEAFIKLTGDAK